MGREKMRSLVTFAIALAVSAALFFALDVVLFNMQGLSFWFKG